MKKLKIYYFPSCPFCRIVLEEIDRQNLVVEFCDIYEDESHYQKLLKDTGRTTVPCLYIDDNPMHESSDIINWLKENGQDVEKRN